MGVPLARSYMLVQMNHRLGPTRSGAPARIRCCASLAGSSFERRPCNDR